MLGSTPLAKGGAPTVGHRRRVSNERYKQHGGCRQGANKHKERRKFVGMQLLNLLFCRLTAINEKHHSMVRTMGGRSIPHHLRPAVLHEVRGFHHLPPIESVSRAKRRRSRPTSRWKPGAGCTDPDGAAGLATVRGDACAGAHPSGTR